MESKEFFGKFKSKYLWGNLLAMAITVVLLCVGVKFGLDIYTHHGEGVPVPNITGMTFNNAANLLDRNGLRIMVSDSGYNKRMPADCILAQSPGEGTSVKMGHTIYVTVNSPSSPTVAIPDIIDNSSVREATAKLTALGFKLLEPKIVTGEKDWVYGVVCHGQNLRNGQKVSIEDVLTIQVGDGVMNMNDDIIYTDPEYMPNDGDSTATHTDGGVIEGEGGHDDFEVENGPE